MVHCLRQKRSNRCARSSSSWIAQQRSEARQFFGLARTAVSACFGGSQEHAASTMQLMVPSSSWWVPGFRSRTSLGIRT